MTQAVSARRALPAAIREGRIVAIGRGLRASRISDVGRALVAGGVHAFEVTLNSDAAFDAIRTLRGQFADDELLVGAGTTPDVDGVDGAIDAGARFIVTPVVDVAVVERAIRAGLPIVPGAFTPTEIRLAWQAGASAVKLFPASAVGPSFVREMRGPLPEIPLVPTGGVTVETAAAWIEAGAVAVGMGSWLTGSGDPVTIESRAREVVAAIAATVRPTVRS
jgi:2-dehydro-3-deoxyphosphogluconate aldolase / (4S)-4-hydroxy-2-oxoglutarate aldolase